jgi:hypothetical protein
LNVQIAFTLHNLSLVYHTQMIGYRR